MRDVVRTLQEYLDLHGIDVGWFWLVGGLAILVVELRVARSWEKLSTDDKAFNAVAILCGGLVFIGGIVRLLHVLTHGK